MGKYLWEHHDQNIPLEELVKIDKKYDYGQAIFGLAESYRLSGQDDKALEAYEAVIRLDQEQPVVMNNLAWLLADAEEPSDEDLDRAMRLAQEAERALCNIVIKCTAAILADGCF